MRSGHDTNRNISISFSREKLFVGMKTSGEEAVKYLNVG
jgi:hypothetical protein